MDRCNVLWDNNRMTADPLLIDPLLLNSLLFKEYNSI